MGLSRQHAGTYAWGFVVFAVLAVLMLGVMRVMQIRWTRTWAEKGGKARGHASLSAKANLAPAKLSPLRGRP